MTAGQGGVRVNHMDGLKPVQPPHPPQKMREKESACCRKAKTTWQRNEACLPSGKHTPVRNRVRPIKRLHCHDSIDNSQLGYGWQRLGHKAALGIILCRWIKGGQREDVEPLCPRRKGRILQCHISNHRYCAGCFWEANHRNMDSHLSVIKSQSNLSL